MTIKTTVPYHHTPIRIARIWNTDNTQMLERCGKVRTLSFIAGGNKKWYTHPQRQIGSFLQNYTLIVQCINHVPWYLPKEIEDLCIRKNLHMDV